jgi:hypothetical protein
MNLTLEERQLERAIGSLHAAFDTAANLGAKDVAILTGIQKQTSTLLNCRLERRALLRQYFEGVSHARTVGDLVGAASCLSHAQLELSSRRTNELILLAQKTTIIALAAGSATPTPPRPVPERPGGAPVPGPRGPRSPYPVNDPGIADPAKPGSEPDYVPPPLPGIEPPAI